MTPVDEKQRHSRARWNPAPSIPWLHRARSFATVTDQICSIILTRKTPLFWWCGFSFGMFLFLVFGVSLTWLLAKGVGDIRHRRSGRVGLRHFRFRLVDWNRSCRHFDFRHSTSVAAELAELHQSLRGSHDADSLLACAGMLPLIHLGRPWFFYWLLPYPDTMTSAAVPQSARVGRLRSLHLRHGVAGVLVRRASSPTWLRCGIVGTAGNTAIYGLLSLGWRGAARHWRFHETASSTLSSPINPQPLVVSVHTVVGIDFTIAILPGWHSTFSRHISSPVPSIRGSRCACPVHSIAHSVRTPQPDHDAASRKLRETDARHRTGACLHVCDRAVHRLVQRRSL